MTKRKDEIADLMTREMGKPLTETRGDVQEGIDTAYYAATEGRRLFGHTVPSEMRNKWAMSFRRPIGVAGIVTPFNFPMAIPTWKMFPALLCGNACIFKPAEDVPHTGHVFVEIMLEAGLPPEVIQLVHGHGETAGAAIVNHPLIPGHLIYGIDGDGAHSWARCADGCTSGCRSRWAARTRCSCSTTRISISRSRACLWGAFGTTGQRCTATSRLVLQDGIHDELLSRLVDRARSLKLGDGRKDGTDVGPLINQGSVEKVQRYVDIGQEEGADLLCGGRRPTGKGVDNGYFFEPTIFARVRAGMRLEQEEIFGPVLSVVRFRTTDEAFAINNDVKYGLSSSVYTRDVNVAMRALNELDTGITYINAPTIGAEAHLPFGGVKQTGNGHREGGWEVYEFYSETKVGYLDFSGALQRAQIDNYLGTPD